MRLSSIKAFNLANTMVWTVRVLCYPQRSERKNSVYTVLYCRRPHCPCPSVRLSVRPSVRPSSKPLSQGLMHLWTDCVQTWQIYWFACRGGFRLL